MKMHGFDPPERERKYNIQVLIIMVSICIIFTGISYYNVLCASHVNVHTSQAKDLHC